MVNEISSSKKMNKLETIFASSNNEPQKYIAGYFEHLESIIQGLDHGAIAKFVDIILTAREQGKGIFFIGNGGSAATASHFANDLSIGTRSKDKPFRICSLTDNNAVMTAIANDFGYDKVFVKQLEALYRPGDILVSISASGNSKNLLEAVDFVKENAGINVGLTGFDGGELKKRCDLVLHVATDKGEYGPVEDVHMIFDHVVGTYLMYLCRAE